jgi:hypothetical protein
LASNGATPTSNNIQFNGIDANNLVENSAAGAQGFEVGTPIPAPDAIQEFRVQTANFDAAYGRGSGANVDLVTKSGTNTFHGSAWEFLRNQIFNANDFFTKGKGLPRAELKQNEFGASLGGPVLRTDRQKHWERSSARRVTWIVMANLLRATSRVPVERRWLAMAPTSIRWPWRS